MVHRFFATFSNPQLLEILQFIKIKLDSRENHEFQPNWSIGPSEKLPVLIRNESGIIRLSTRLFGVQNRKYDKGTNKNSSFLQLNSRAEDAKMKFSSQAKNIYARAIVVVDGYYEWTEDRSKVYSIQMVDKKQKLYLAAMALSEESIVVFTQEAQGEIMKIHPRMPVFVDQERIDQFLKEDDFEKARSLVEEFNKELLNGKLQVERIGEKINDPKCKGIECLTSYTEFQKKQQSTGIMKFFQVKKQENSNQQEQKNQTESKITNYFAQKPSNEAKTTNQVNNKPQVSLNEEMKESTKELITSSPSKDKNSSLYHRSENKSEDIQGSQPTKKMKLS